MAKFITNFLKDENGAPPIECWRIPALIPVVIVTGVTIAGSKA